MNVPRAILRPNTGRILQHGLYDDLPRPQCRYQHGRTLGARYVCRGAVVYALGENCVLVAAVTASEAMTEQSQWEALKNCLRPHSSHAEKTQSFRMPHSEIDSVCRGVPARRSQFKSSFRTASTLERLSLD